MKPVPGNTGESAQPSVNSSRSRPGAGSARAPAKKKAAPASPLDEGPLIPGEGEPHAVWRKFLEHEKPSGLRVRQRVTRLYKAKEYEQAIALIETCLIEGQVQAWMYEVLGLTMEVAGRPDAQVERVLLSTVDFTALDLESMLFLAAYLTRLERPKRALALYQQASRIDPWRQEPYVLGLKLAVASKDPEAVQWAACGILQRGWARDYDALQHAAELAAADARSWLEKENDPARLADFDRALADARQRDLVVRLAWSGDADLDLMLEEPPGSVCSFETPISRGGGVLVHDGYGPKQSNTWDLYVCPQGVAGDYRIRVRYIGGNVVAKSATLTITRYAGTPRELVRTRTIPIGREDYVLRVSLLEGRRRELAPEAPAQASRLAEPRRRTLLQKVGPLDAAQVRAAGRFRNSRLLGNAVEGVRRGLGGNVGSGAVGYQPIVRTIPEGIRLSAQAVISADRRYVRITALPVFSTVNDIFTFSFVSFGGGGGSGTPGR